MTEAGRSFSLEWANVEIKETEGDEKICLALFAFEPRRREKKWRESGQDSDKAKTSNSNSKWEWEHRQEQREEGDEEQQCKEVETLGPKWESGKDKGIGKQRKVILSIRVGRKRD